MAIAPSPIFSDLTLSDPDEMMKVTNTGKVKIRWKGVRRIFEVAPQKTEFIPFFVCVRYLGDPRSVRKRTETFQTPNGDKGVIPERGTELSRLSIFYGLYQAKIRDLPKHAPKVHVTTLLDHEVSFPIFNADSVSYGYDTSQTPMTDVRTELERMQAQMAQMEQQYRVLQDASLADDPEAGEATADGPSGLMG